MRTAEGEAGKSKRVVPSSVLCARCNQNLDEVIKVDARQDGKRQQCYAFRLMIPNNAGKVPDRTVRWVCGAVV